VGASWVLETGSVTVAGVRCEGSGASVCGADILLETRLSAAKYGLSEDIVPDSHCLQPLRFLTVGICEICRFDGHRLLPLWFLQA